MSARIFVDCSHTLATRGDRGIGRVVRKLALAAAERAQVTPVVFDSGAFRRADARALENVRPGDSERPLVTALSRACFTALSSAAALLPATHGERLLAKTVYDRRIGARTRLYQWLAFRAPGWRDGGEPAPRGAAPAELAAGDVLFLPDAIWNTEIGTVVPALRERGVRVVWLCHDLLPATHPGLCPDPGAVFRRWLCGWLPQVDGVVCNSESTKRALLDFARTVGITWRSGTWIEACPLGGDLEAVAREPRLHPPISSATPYFLTVGAIEPRKNHALLLHAFEWFWRGGGKAHGVWAGRWTLDAEPLRRRVARHDDLGRRLIVLNGASDEELVALYRNARAAVFPSLAEGFGLAPAEALFHGCPVIASDIPAHREVCGDRALYFDPHDAAALANLLAELERGERSLTRPAPGGFRSWRESIDEIFDTIERHSNA